MNFFGLFYIADWLLLLILFVVAIHEFLTWRYEELENLEIPGPKPSVPLGNLSEVFKLGLMNADALYVKKYGKVFGTYIGRRPMITVADLDIARQIFIKDFDNFSDRLERYMRGTLKHGVFDTNGKRWRTMRRKLTPAFTSGKLKQMTNIMEKCAKALVDNLDEFAKSGEMFEVKSVTNAFTSDNMASTSFGIELSAQNTPDHPFVRSSKAIFDTPAKSIFIVMSMIMPYLAKWVEKVKPSWLPKDAEECLVKILTEAIQKRKESPTDRKDLMQLILDAEKELKKLDDETKAIFDEGLGFSENDESGLSHEEVISNLFLFLLVGHDTTSGTLSFLLYNLAIHPDAQENIAEEISDVVGGKALTYDLLSQLTYMEKCINESMRLYPLVVKLDRVCLNDWQYGDLRIPKGFLVGIPIRYFHYHPEIWPDPEKFDPHRFDAEEKAKRDPLAFMPFGQGPRMCIGNRFAMVTIKVALVYILSNFRILKCEKTEVPIKIRKTSLLLQPENGIWLKTERRQ